MSDSQSAQQRSGGFRIGQCWIEPAANEIGGVRIDAKAMDVLVALVAAAPGVLSVAQLLEQVWPRVVVGDNVVHQAIANLRKALGDDARAPVHVQSIPRRGYRLISKIDRESSPAISADENSAELPAPAGKPAARIEVQLPRASNRINVAIIPALQAEDRGTLELATSITRYISWDGGPFRAIRADRSDRGTRGRAIDYLVEITLHELSGQLRAVWQVECVQTTEIVWASQHEAAEVSAHDRVAQMIGEGALRVIADHELRRIAVMDANELSYGQLVLKAARFNGRDRARIAERYALLARAIELEPTTALAYAVLADLLLWKLINGITHDAETDASIARSAAQQAFELDPDDPRVILSVGQTYCRIGQYDEGLALIRRACALAPTIRARNELAMGLCFAGQPDEAIVLLAESLTTMVAASTFRDVYGRLAIALTQAGRLVDALKYSEQYVIHVPTDCYGWVTHANLLAQLGRVEDGSRAIAEAQRLVPTLRLEQAIAHTEATYGRNPEQTQRLTTGLRSLRARRSGMK